MGFYLKDGQIRDEEKGFSYDLAAGVSDALRSVKRQLIIRPAFEFYARRIVNENTAAIQPKIDKFNEEFGAQVDAIIDEEVIKQVGEDVVKEEVDKIISGELSKLE